MVALGSGSNRQIEDVMPTRYACYLIARNGDPEKEEIAFARSCFAVQIRKQEIIEEHIRLAERLNIRERSLQKIKKSKFLQNAGLLRVPAVRAGRSAQAPPPLNPLRKNRTARTLFLFSGQRKRSAGWEYPGASSVPRDDIRQRQ